MHEPDYSDYTLNQLHDCLNHINRSRYPERYRRLTAEIELRLSAGEGSVEPLIDQLFPLHIPFTLGLRVLWCFCSRFAVLMAGVHLLWAGAGKINEILHLLGPSQFTAARYLSYIFCGLLGGTFVMMQALAKHYHGYRIRVIKHRSPDQETARTTTETTD